MRLLSWLSKMFCHQTLPTRLRGRGRNHSNRSCAVQRLEPRVLLSASPVGSETQVDTNYNYPGSTAMDADGDYVVVWQDHLNVTFQRYGSDGTPQGGEVLVTNSSHDRHSAVAMDASGDFVVTWSSYYNQDGSGVGIYAQRFNSVGEPEGGIFRVNTETGNDQYASLVAMDKEGDFVIAWTSVNQDGDFRGVYAQRYDANGLAQGNEFRVNTTTANDQTLDGLAMDADGDFVVTWTSVGQDSIPGNAVFAQRYDAAGVAQGGEFKVNTYTTGGQRGSTVSMDDAGDFVVAWNSWYQDGSNSGVYAQRYNSNGVAQGSEFRVNSTTTNIQIDPSVAMDADGDFVITWSSYGQDGSRYGVYAQRYSPAGVAQGSEFRVNTTTYQSQNRSVVTMDDAGDFVVSWTSAAQGSGSYGVYFQRYQESTDAAGPIVAQVLEGNRLIFEGGQVVNDISSLTVVMSEDLNVTGGASGANSATNPANWMLTRNGSDITSNISGITFGLNATTNRYEAVLTFATPQSDGDYVLTARQTIQDLAGNALDGDLNGTPGGDFIRSFTIVHLLTGIESTPLPYAPNAAATIVTSTLNVADPGVPITGATVKISGGYQLGDVLSFTNTPNITGVFNTYDGTLTLTGSDTAANYQAALRSVTYASSTESPAARTISFQVTDGTNPSDIVSRTVGGYAQLVGGTVNVYGTSLTNNITVAEGATLDIVVDGVLTQFTPAQVTAIVIHGYAGDDSIQVNSLANGTALTAYGDSGNDTLKVNSVVTQAVTLDGGDDNDLLIGGSGNDTLLGGNGNDLLKGGDGFDDLSGEAGNDYLYGEGDSDNMRGGDGSDMLVGGAGNEAYYFEDATTDETDTVVEVSDGGFDQLYFGSMTSGVTVDLTSDAAMATMSHRVVKTGAVGQAANLEIVTGGSGNDSITGNAAANFLMGGEGDDTIDGGDGDDPLLDGEGGNDIVIGGNGNDSLLGGTGDDRLIGGTGNNSLVGGAGDDTYVFTDATVNQLDVVRETADLGAGTGDTLDFSAMTVPLTIDLTSDNMLAGSAHLLVQTGQPGQALNFENAIGGSANDSITGNSSVNVLTGNGGNDTLIGNDNDDWLYGGDGNDLLKGGNGNDRLNGNNQDDVLQGGIGDDIVDGEAGNDLIDGGEGSDMLFGGDGSDSFLFSDASVNQVDSVNEQPEAPGTDSLNFSGLTTAVNVDLTSASTMATMAHRIVGVIAGDPAAIENVIGGAGNDQITGNAANNLLMGGNGNDTKGISGRNILIGGTGGDVLQGGADDDLLLSGTSTYEANPTILQVLLTEWASANPYQTRVDHLLGTTGGGANSTFILSPATVKTDADADYLTGSGGRDWFLANSLQDVITDRAVDEVFTQIDTWL